MQKSRTHVQWTRKVAGKTVGRRLRSEEVELFQEWIANSRRLDRLLAEMQKVSMRATETLLRRRFGPRAGPATAGTGRGGRGLG
jgi:hypothetical protein